MATAQTTPAAAAAAPPAGPSAAVGTAKVFEWKDIWEYCKQNKQPNSMNNMALKYYRWCYEDPAGEPTERRVELDLQYDTHEIYLACHAEKGSQFWFDPTCDKQPWSWRHLFGALRTAPEEFYSSGVVSLSVVAIPKTCDHHRLHNQRSDFQPGVRPPVWDFVAGMADGSEWRLHPRFQRGKVDIAKWDGGAFDSPIPAAGPGNSDGPGTYKRITEAHYGPEAGRMYYEVGVDPKRDEHRSRHLAAKKAAKDKAAASAVAGTGAASSTSAPTPSP